MIKTITVMQHSVLHQTPIRIILVVISFVINVVILLGRPVAGLSILRNCARLLTSALSLLL